MNDQQVQEHDKAQFRAILTPNRSLSQRGFIILMTAISLISFIIGAIFWSAGAWPIMGFFGLDVLLIYVAFRMNYRTGRAFETVELYPKSLVLTRVDPEGRKNILEFNPYWVRVNLTKWPDGRTALHLLTHGRNIIVGDFLANEERESFAKALSFELEKARTATA